MAWIDAGTEGGPPVRKKHPDDWPGFVGARGGGVELTRTFSAPSNLDADEGVFVVLTGVLGTGTIRLNDVVIGTFTEERRSWEFAIPQPMPFFNVLTITVRFPPPTAAVPQVGVNGDVVLEIRQTASA